MCSTRHWWFLDNESRCNAKQGISLALKRQWQTINSHSSTPVAVLCQFNTVGEAVWSVMAMWTRWQSSHTVVTLNGTVLIQVSSHCLHSRKQQWISLISTTITIAGIYITTGTYKHKNGTWINRCWNLLVYINKHIKYIKMKNWKYDILLIS